MRNPLKNLAMAIDARSIALIGTALAMVLLVKQFLFVLVDSVLSPVVGWIVPKSLDSASFKLGQSTVMYGTALSAGIGTAVFVGCLMLCFKLLRRVPTRAKTDLGPPGEDLELLRRIAAALETSPRLRHEAERQP